MIIIKTIILLTIFASSSALGIMLANRYKDRVLDLKQMRSALNIMKTKITYTYDPLPQIFIEISDKFNNSIRRNLQNSKSKKISAGEAWKYALDQSKTNMKEEDIKVLINLEKLLRKNRYRRTTKRNRANRKIYRRANCTCRRGAKEKCKTI